MIIYGLTMTKINMKKNKSFLIAFNLIAAATICNWGIVFYSIPQFDWFLILWPVVPVVLLMIAVSYMPRENVVNENDFKSGVSGQLPERWQPCGKGENICNCKNASECGYIEFYAGIARLDGEGNFR